MTDFRSRKPEHIPYDLWECMYIAWLEVNDMKPSAVGDASWRAIEFAANRVYYNQGRLWVATS